MADVIGLWISAFLTIGITSLAWKDQPLSKFCEHIYLGVVAANSIVMAARVIMDSGLAKLTSGNFLLIIPIILGIASYARYTKKYFWVYRYAIALVVGVGIGTSMRGHVGGSFIDQIKDSFYQLSVPGDLMSSFNNLFMLATIISCLLYFVFTIKATTSPIALKLSTFGRYTIMAAFGYTFANSLATRINQYAGRVGFLVLEWLQLG